MSDLNVGDKVYHKKLELYGTVLFNNWNNPKTCYVDFESGDGNFLFLFSISCLKKI